MLEWNFRILLFTRNRDRDRFQPNKFKMFRNGKYSMEVDLRFSLLDEGLDYVSDISEIDELYIFARGESVSLNSPKEMLNRIDEGFHSMSEEKYWFAHEIFEDFWKQLSGDKSKFFHGVVLLCVSMVHYQMNHNSNSIRIFGDAKMELREFLEEARNWEYAYPLDESIINLLRTRSIFMTKT